MYGSTGCLHTTIFSADFSVFYPPKLSACMFLQITSQMRQRPPGRRVPESLFSQMAWCGGGHHLSALVLYSRAVGHHTQPQCDMSSPKEKPWIFTQGFQTTTTKRTNYRTLVCHKPQQKSRRASLGVFRVCTLNLTSLDQMCPQAVEVLGIPKPEFAGHH